MPLGKKITATTIKALQILRDHTTARKNWGVRGMTAAQFALKMWPDSTAWRKSYGGYSTDRGPVQGAGIIMSAGSYLRKLWIRQLVIGEREDRRDGVWRWRVSAQGARALRMHGQPKKVGKKKRSRGRSCRSRKS